MTDSEILAVKKVGKAIWGAKREALVARASEVMEGADKAAISNKITGVHL